MKSAVKQKKLEKGNGRSGIMIDDAYQKIKEMIYYNQLAPGQKLIYSNLAEKLNKSITPIIQALNRLEKARLVTYVPNKGFFVGEITEAEAVQLYQAREALEIYMLPSIIKNFQAKTIEDIRREDAFKKYEGANRRMLFLHDAQFHLRIAEYAQNEVILQLLKDVFERIFLKYRPEYLDHATEKAALREHREILETLAKGDLAEATAIVKAHINFGLERIVESLRASESANYIHL